MKTYEGMFLLDPSSADFEAASAPIRTLLDRIDAEVLSMKPWDERRLAYEIKGRKRGLYVLSYFKAPPGEIASLNHEVQISEDILRLMVLSADHLGEEQINAETPATAAQIRRATADAEKAARAEAAAEESAKAAAQPTEAAKAEAPAAEPADEAKAEAPAAEPVEEATPDEPAAQEPAASEETEAAEPAKEAEPAEEPAPAETAEPDEAPADAEEKSDAPQE